MSSTELGSLGEFISSLAVLVTLVFLVLQIRQSNRIATTSELALRHNMRMASQAEMAGSPYWIPIMEKASTKTVANQAWWAERARVCERYGVSEEEFQRVYMYWAQLFQYWEYWVLHPIKDEMGEVSGGADWRFQVNMGGNLSQPLCQEVYQLSRHFFDRRFQQAMDDLIEQVMERQDVPQVA